MSARLNLMAMRFARGLMACALRYWPERTREWGMALAAEMEEITGAWDTLRWSLGGIMLFTRSLASEFVAWLRLPAGTSLSSNRTTSPSFLPKRSRLFTACVLVAAGALLVLPESRQAITTLRASWQEFLSSSTNNRELEKLATRAEKENDAAMLAFVALSVDDPDRFATRASRAVALDPQFIWIYAAAPNTRYAGRGLSSETLQRLQTADPGNAMLKLLAAEGMEKPDFKELYQQPSSKNARIEKLLECCPQWTAQMGQVFAAPYYDGYFQRHFLLTTAIWNRENSLSPFLALNGLGAHRILGLWSLEGFSTIRIRQASEALAAGNLPEAQRLLAEVDSFGQKMYAGSSTMIERGVSLAISRNANEALRELYTATGNSGELTKTDLRLQHLKQRQRGLCPTRGKNTLKTWGIALNVSALLALLAAISTLSAILLLELRPATSEPKASSNQKVLCWAADHAPAVLLFSGVAFILSFVPYARAFAAYRSSHDAFSNEQLGRALRTLWMVPGYLFSLEFAIVFWYSVIVALAALALFIIGRAAYRGSHAATHRI